MACWDVLEGPGLSPVLRLALERGTRAPGAELLAGALAPLGAGRGVAVPDTGQALTARELEVLRLVAGGLGNQVESRSWHAAWRYVPHARTGGGPENTGASSTLGDEPRAPLEEHGGRDDVRGNGAIPIIVVQGDRLQASGRA